MQPLTKIKAVLFPPIVKLVDTLDDMFHRTSIYIKYPGETVTMDLLIENKNKLYHPARLNITWSDTDKCIIDVCPPDNATLDVFQWINGAPVIRTHDTKSLVSVQLTPEKPLEIGLDKKAWKDAKNPANNP
jgi:hypothetical protein